MTRRIRVALVAAVFVMSLSGCAAATAPTETPATTASTEAVAASDVWTKAAEKDGMTAVFGMLHNNTDADLTLVSAATDASPDVQLHETKADASGNMVMSEVDGGLVIPARGMLMLEPGGNHIMLMGLARTLEPGDEITVTLTFDDGSTQDLTSAVKDFTGANENYHEGHETPSTEHSGH